MTSFRIVIIFFLASIIGIALISGLSVDLNPRAKEPVLNISYAVRNAPPELVEKPGTSPLEGTLELPE